ncbi:MAG: hypothetical protein ABI353_12195 [Isosphaeraceae bacterium]
MIEVTRWIAVGLILVMSARETPAAPAREVKLLDRKPDPHGAPRPARMARDVPLGTSLYLELDPGSDAKTDTIDPDSVVIQIQVEGGEPRELLGLGQRFAKGVSGWLRPKGGLLGGGPLAIYLEPGSDLTPATKYTARVKARSREGAVLPDAKGAWSFTTEEAPRVHPITFPLDLNAKAVHWRGAFFSGFGNISFCTKKESFGSTYELMDEARKDNPAAWSLQRDFWMTGTDFRPAGFADSSLPNIVRERETRRITAIEPQDQGVLLHLDDVFGGEQYGVKPGQPIADDFHPDDEVLIADGVHDARAKVIKADNAAKTVLVSSFATPEGGWNLEYVAPLPTRDDPDAPGLFPPGGGYLRKFNPHGTPCYYWGRLDKEWDMAHRRFGRRLLPNFTDATGDLSRDGRSWTTVKDYAQWHEVAGVIAGHIIDRYGDDSLTFVWSIFNEPDLGALFWRADWDELQRYYDYTTDAILRAFENRGYDSSKVFIGGLELGGIFGVHLKLTEFLAHCSPKAQAKGALPLNAAFADKRLDGKRSKRVESLCKANEGKGSPCDFVSIHSYNRSELMAAKLIRAKEIALEIDPEYYRDLWVNSHESCPDWMPPPDKGAADSYLSNGYFPTWCVDVASRQLHRAAQDPRFGFGESILTIWPPNQNFGGLNAMTRTLHADDDGDGRADREVTIPMQIFHVLNYLSRMSEHYWTFPDQTIGGHVVSGFASRVGDAVQVLLYTHHEQDTQARSKAEFEIELDVKGLDWARTRVQEFRFDADHNSYYRPGAELRDRAETWQDNPAKLDPAIQALSVDDPPDQLEALRTLDALGPAARAALPAIFQLLGKSRDVDVLASARATIKRIIAPSAYPRAEVERIEKLAECRPTASTVHSLNADGRLTLKARVAGNGLNILILEEDAKAKAGRSSN